MWFAEPGGTWRFLALSFGPEHLLDARHMPCYTPQPNTTMNPAKSNAMNGEENMDYRRIIPCLDVKHGRLVKGVNFVDLKDVGDPAENAAAYSEAGADELVFLDITATLENRKTLLDAVKRTVERISVPLTVGGGINSCQAIEDLLGLHLGFAHEYLGLPGCRLL